MRLASGQASAASCSGEQRPAAKLSLYPKAFGNRTDSALMVLSPVACVTVAVIAGTCLEAYVDRSSATAGANGMGRGCYGAEALMAPDPPPPATFLAAKPVELRSGTVRLAFD